MPSGVTYSGATGTRVGRPLARSTTAANPGNATLPPTRLTSGTGQPSVLRATIVGRSAGELILPWVLTIGQGLGMAAMAGVIAPYPTLSEVSKRVASTYYAPKLFSAFTRRIVGLLQRMS